MVDKIIFGDNQFFGINHRSQDKAEEMLQRFSKLQSIIDVYDDAIDCGVHAIMLNSNDKAVEITDYFREHKAKYGSLAWYPSIPYPHKYADMVNELGIFPAINEAIFKNNNTVGALGIMAKGTVAAFGKDMLKMMEMLIDVEFKMFRGLDVKALFLQNVITDLILGYNIKDVFLRYCDYIRKKYRIVPAFITLNLPFLSSKFKEWGIEDVIICSSINSAGFNMHPTKEQCESVIAANDSSKYQLIAMNVLASGSISPKESFDYIKSLNVQSVVFGASSRAHIKSTMDFLVDSPF